MYNMQNRNWHLKGLAEELWENKQILAEHDDCFTRNTGTTVLLLQRLARNRSKQTFREGLSIVRKCIILHSHKEPMLFEREWINGLEVCTSFQNNNLQTKKLTQYASLLTRTEINYKQRSLTGQYFYHFVIPKKVWEILKLVSYAPLLMYIF